MQLIPILVILMSLCFTNCANAQVVFEDNFDSLPDWQNTCERSGVGCGCDQDSCKGDALSTWDYWNVDEYWNPGIDGDASQAQFTLSSAYKRGTVGKGLAISNEAHKGRSGDGWGSDGVILKRLPSEYPELYIRLWIKYSPTYVWQKDGAAAKMLRVMHNDDTFPVAFSGGTTGTNAPLFFYDATHKDTFTQSTGRFNSFRCDPQSTDYYCPPGYEQPGTQYTTEVIDGQFHRYDYHLKMNTAVGTADGIFQLSVDGILEDDRTNIEWLRSGSDPVGWNMFGIGGNNNNSTSVAAIPNLIADAVSGQIEQYFIIDDVVASTTAIPADYVIGGTSPPPAPTCSDSIQNQGETGVDCGGPCAACDVGAVVPVTSTNKPSARYTATQSVTLECSDDVACTATKFCYGVGCTPTTTYENPFPVLKNLASQTYCTSGEDGTNVEVPKCYTLKKQRRK